MTISQALQNRYRSRFKKRCKYRPAVFTVPTEFMTDLASATRALWAFVATFDVARAAIVHDLLYKQSDYTGGKKQTRRRQRINQRAKSGRDKVFLLAMKDAEH